MSEAMIGDNFSNRSDDLLNLLEPDFKTISAFSYFNENLNFIPEHLETLKVVDTLVSHVIDEVATFLYVKYIDGKLDDYVLSCSTGFLESLCGVEYQMHDGEGEFGWREDEEPGSTGHDNWVRNKVMVEKRTNLSEVIRNTRDDVVVGGEEASEGRLSLIKSNASRIQNKQVGDLTKESKKLEITIVPLPEEIKLVFDPLEEQVRMKKERENKLKEEKTQEAKLRQEEVKEQQYRLKGIQSESSKKNYTYDYEGNIIMFQQVKIDKLPPSNYQMSFDISTVAPSATSAIRPAPKKEQKTLTISKPTQKTLQEPPPKFIPSPSIFDLFTPLPGVTLVEGGRMKGGAKEVKMLSLADGGKNGDGGRMSKSEYLQLTRGGNLSRSQAYSSTTTEKDKRERITRMEDLLQKEVNATTNEVNLSSFTEDLKLKKNKPSRIEDGNVSIKILSRKGLFTLIEQEDEKIELPKLEGPPKQTEPMKTPVDEFNLHILRSKEWGKANIQSGFLPSLRGGVKPEEKDFKGSLGITLLRNPRDRINKKSKGERSGKHLGPPMVGKTFGHGLINNSSFEKLVN